MNYYYENQEALKKYCEKMSVKSILTFGRNKEILNAILACHKTDEFGYGERDKKRNTLYYTLWTKNTDSLTSIFAGSEYKVLVTLFGKEWARKFKKVWDNSPDYIYSTGYDRRSFRSKTYDALYLATAMDKLNDMVQLAAGNFSYEAYFASKDNRFAYNSVVADLIALEIDENNESVIHTIENIVYGDNNTGLITREIIKGLLMSHSPKAHKWVGDLLLAAKLQEGLRQTIVECMDEASKEGFLYILKLILDHNLLRFSSVVRALDVWTGLGITVEKPAVIKNCLETAYKCLTNNAYAEECLNGDNALLIYMGLWSIAFDEVALVETKLQSLMAADGKYKRLVALFFLTQIQIPRLQHKLALSLLDDPEYEVKSWVLKNLYSDMQLYYLKAGHTAEIQNYQNIEGIWSPEELFEKLKRTLDGMPKKEKIFTGSIFPWLNTAVSSDEITVKMLLTLAGKPADDKVDLMLDYRDKMSVNTRQALINVFLNPPKTVKQKTAIIELMGDKSSQVRDSALKKVEKLSLLPDDYIIVENLLQYKAGDLRKNAISVLLKQEPREIQGSIKRLIDDSNDHKYLAALDIISTIEKNPRYKGIVEECKQMAAGLSESSQQAKILVEKITNTKHEALSAAEGFGLYQPNQQIPLPELAAPSGFSSKAILSSSFADIKEILQALSQRVEQHKEFEYEIEEWGGARLKVILGGESTIRRIRHTPAQGGLPTLKDYPLAEVWREAYDKHNLSTHRLLEILFYYHLDRQYFRNKQDWYKKLLTQLFPVEQKEFSEFTRNLPYSNHVYTLLQAMLNECPSSEIFATCRNMTSFIFQKIPKKYFAQEYEKTEGTYYYGGRRDTLVNAPEIAFWYSKMRASGDLNDDQQFTDVFHVGYTLYRESGYLSHTCLQLADFERAYKLGLVDENELYAELCGRPLSPDNLRVMTNAQFHNHKSVADCQKLNEVCQKVVNRVVSVELKRGDMTTEVSHLAARIYKCTGTKFFVEILVGSEKDSYVRGYNFVGDDSTKKQIFSHLLKNCYPADGEDENTLRELLNGRKMSEKQLLDAVMYAPQWLDIVEKYLAWPGLKSACWYFHAHVNEYFSHDKETIVARYSPISPEDFKNGAFDLDWFHEAHSQLGPKRFKVVYNSAKYIAGGGLHKRSQLFTDAMLGKISSDQAEKIITEKRNKDYVLLFGLIPLEKDKQELLHRYEYLHRFLKESKQFGAQRRASEAKAVAISLENLARNAGFSDTNRFTWYMETEKIKAIEGFLKPVTVGDWDIHIRIDDLGRASIEVSKDGKPVKSIPAKLKNHEYVTELKTVHKSLKDQYSRARVMLERAMEAEDEFTVQELENLSEHPVISPLLKNLIFKCGDHLGYLAGGELTGTEGQLFPLNPEDTCIIAHPVHLFHSGKWPSFQQDIYRREIIQPFKQVFRELYLPNADELEARTISSRYDGHQVQPRKAAALLKGRGWTVSYEEGLQKVYYKDNIIAQLYAMADWYSPADVEAPTIEGVRFTDRKTGKAVAFIDVPEVIFSEIMRDVDLVVSVAHVGGVDPEASLSTVEMRTAIITELVRLFKFTNVELKGSHAFIKGTLGDYTVHLGSGVVHKMAQGALHILPIHSQHRGRIFLPFIDDDPKTAEITSKIVMLAEDTKIKDPTVLVQMT